MQDCLLRLFAFNMLIWCLPGQVLLPANAEHWTAKVIEERSFDFRTVGRGTKCEHHFEIKNPLSVPIHVKAVRSSCGCTSPTLTKDTIAPGETSAVIAVFNTSSFVGKKSATITVVFDKPYFSEVQLKVSGYIRTDVTFDPPEVAFGEFAAGDEREQEIVITHTGNTKWAITDVRSHCDHLRVRLDTPERTGNQVRYRMVVQTKSTIPEGDLRERLTLISNDRNFPTTEMTIEGRVRETLSVSPAAVNLGSTAPDGIVEQRLVVKGEDPFEIREVVCSDNRFSFEIPEGKKKLHFVKLRFEGDGGEGDITQSVKIVTDLVGDKSASCMVTGSTLQ
jgi:hypothetical protein